MKGHPDSSPADHSGVLSVSAIQEGTVIDHIRAGQALYIVKALQLATSGRQVTVGLNLKSASMGIKDLIKVEGVFLSDLEASQIALFSPEAIVNRIENYRVIQKRGVVLPETIDRFLLCPHPNCISQSDPLSSSFRVIRGEGDPLLICRFCERQFSRKEVRERW
jgi:aspartate carbamoyltransferase regulatory subunit